MTGASTNYSHEEHVAAGLKASIKNPNVSDEAKDRAAQRLEEMGEDYQKGDSEKQQDDAEYGDEEEDDGEEEEVVLDGGDNYRGYGTTKKRTGKKSQGEDQQDSHEAEVHEHRVIGGYKATLKNPNVSDEAKENARAKLDEYDA